MKPEETKTAHKPLQKEKLPLANVIAAASLQRVTYCYCCQW